MTSIQLLLQVLYQKVAKTKVLFENYIQRPHSPRGEKGDDDDKKNGGKRLI